LIRIKEPVDKDQEMHQLVRWQFRGGIKEKDRRAFLFENPADAKGQRYDIPVAIGAPAANRTIYGSGRVESVARSTNTMGYLNTNSSLDKAKRIQSNLVPSANRLLVLAWPF
jgi:3-polyprenyl-4-hydroxybenzoate decarboxylase